MVRKGASVSDLIQRLRHAETPYAKPWDLDRLTNEAADALEAANAVTNQVGSALGAAHSRIADLETKCRLYEASLDKSDREADGMKKDAERYRWLRRRAVMADYSDEMVTTIALFKDEGPSGEFLDDQIDGEITKAKK